MYRISTKATSMQLPSPMLTRQGLLRFRPVFWVQYIVLVVVACHGLLWKEF